jgi:transcriptional regulator with XRE-family HTH domain
VAQRQDPPPIFKLGTVIRRRRKECELTQRQLAERAGLHFSHISYLESDSHFPSWQALCSLSTALGIRPSRLMRMAEDLQSEG